VSFHAVRWEKASLSRGRVFFTKCLRSAFNLFETDLRPPSVTDTQKDLIDPAVIGTTGILKAIKKNAPSVKRVVITSSFASILNASKGPSWSDHTCMPILQILSTNDTNHKETQNLTGTL